MSHFRIFFAVIFFLVFQGWAFCALNKVAYVESGLTPPGALGELISSCGFQATPVTEEIKAGQFRLTPYNVVVFGSYSTRIRKVALYFENAAEELRKFVQKGGVVMVFAQDKEDQELETWMLPGFQVLRGDAPYSPPAFIERSHPIFSYPNAISHRRFSRDWKTGDQGWEPFRIVSRGWVLAAQDKKGRNPWCVEYGWGRGRVIYLGCQPEAFPGQPPKQKELTRELVENLLDYAAEVGRGKPAELPDHAVLTEKKTGFRPKVLIDSSTNDFSFEAAVNAAADNGVAFLKGRQKEDGSWKAHGNYEIGPTALAVVALLSAGVSKYDKSVKEAVSRVLDFPPTRYDSDTNTYEVGLMLMALDAWAAPMHERFELARLPPEQRERFKFVRELNEEEREFMILCKDWLIYNQTEKHYWSYSPDRRSEPGDISNTQFAILGLRSAARCGIDVPGKTWLNIIDGFLRYQSDGGQAVPLPYFRCLDFKTGKPKFYVFSTRTRTWGYFPNGRGVSGSRCAIGVSSLLIALEGLAMKNRSAGSEKTSDVRKAVMDGVAYLWQNWSVKENPNLGDRHFYYYLYALERVGVLFNSPCIGDRDWYKEGAVELLRRQAPNGSWGEKKVVDTCFALMFLKRSTPPSVITLRK